MGKVEKHHFRQGKPKASGPEHRLGVVVPFLNTKHHSGWETQKSFFNFFSVKNIFSMKHLGPRSIWPSTWLCVYAAFPHKVTFWSEDRVQHLM